MNTPWQQTYSLFGQGLAVSAVIAAIPVVTLLFLLGVKRKPAWFAAICSLMITLVLALVGRSGVLRNLGTTAALEQATSDAGAALPLARQMGYPTGEAMALFELSVISSYADDGEQAPRAQMRRVFEEERRLVNAGTVEGSEQLARSVVDEDPREGDPHDDESDVDGNIGRAGPDHRGQPRTDTGLLRSLWDRRHHATTLSSVMPRPDSPGSNTSRWEFGCAVGTTAEVPS